ncbi:MAG: hypothetical protein IH845_01360 [Nanoarchaeota archaeon]|nr:hypothetical protein [Nanoarchaeota archaeon]
MRGRLNKIDKAITFWLKEHGYIFLRYSLAVIFIWFGALKTFGISPAADLVSNTVYFFDPAWFVSILGIWEVLIGICLLYRPLIRAGLFLMGLQMVGTFLPLIILPGVIFTQFPYGLTLEGQYIIKNLILIGAGMIVGSHIRDPY